MIGVSLLLGWINKQSVHVCSRGSMLNLAAGACQGSLHKHCGVSSVTALVVMSCKCIALMV
jgi:hypothetical protein